MIFWWLISILRIICKIFKHKIEQQQQHAICQNEFIIIKLIVDKYFFFLRGLFNERLVQLRSLIKQNDG